MRKYLAMLLVFSAVGCGHIKKEKSPKETYSPKITFSQEEKIFEASVKVPKDMKDKVPLVVIVHEWWGKNEYIESRSEMLNKEGFATLAVDLFGNNKVVETPPDAMALATPFYQNPQMGVDRLNKYIAEAKLSMFIVR